MSDGHPQGPADSNPGRYPGTGDWWMASDGKWYAPELHPDYKPDYKPEVPPQVSPSAPAPIGGFEPPAFDSRVDPASAVGAQLPGMGEDRVGPPGPPQPGAAYPGPAQPGPAQPGPAHSGLMYAVPKKRSTGKIVAIVFGVLFLLFAGGCGVFVWAFGEELGDALVSFEDGVVTDDPTSCRVTGTDFAEDYVIEATVVAESAQVQSHYELEVVVAGSAGQTIGVAAGVLRSVDPGEQRTEEVYNTIDSAEPIESVTCEVRRVLRIDA